MSSRSTSTGLKQHNKSMPSTWRRSRMTRHQPSSSPLRRTSGESHVRARSRIRSCRRRSTGRMPSRRRRAAPAAEFNRSHPSRRLRARCQDRGMTRVQITVGAFLFEARLEAERAPKSCARFSAMLPLKTRLIQARWSGEAAWIPFGDRDLGLGYENHTSDPAPGQLLLYPGGISEAEILFPYGAAVFGSKMGQLAGEHFATVEDGAEQLPALGRVVLWEGAQDITFEAV